jgi:hypothetical protein
MEEDTGLVFDFWDSGGEIVRQVVDVFWRGALVSRWLVLLAGGCYLPVPRASVVAVGATDGEVAGLTVKASEVALARLLQQLAGRGGVDFDFELKATGAVVVSDGDVG